MLGVFEGRNKKREVKVNNKIMNNYIKGKNNEKGREKLLLVFYLFIFIINGEHLSRRLIRWSKENIHIIK